MEPRQVPNSVELNTRIHASAARVVSVPLWSPTPSQEESWLYHTGQFPLHLAMASTPALTTACPHWSFMHSINLLEMHLGLQISIYLPLFHKKTRNEPQKLSIHRLQSSTQFWPRLWVTLHVLGSLDTPLNKMGADSVETL